MCLLIYSGLFSLSHLLCHLVVLSSATTLFFRPFVVGNSLSTIARPGLQTVLEIRSPSGSQRSGTSFTDSDLMEQQLSNEPNPRTPFSGEAGQQIPPLNTSESKTGNTSSPEMEGMSLSNSMDTPMGNAPNSGSGLGLGGAGGVQQPKVQTAFIHKLYKY